MTVAEAFTLTASSSASDKGLNLFDTSSGCGDSFFSRMAGADEEPDMSLLEQAKDHTLISTFQIKPALEDKFKPQQAKELIHSVLHELLHDKAFPSDENERKELVKSLAVKIKQRCREMDFAKYKLVVNVVLGEQRGAGVNCASRCFWDADTDSCASDTFLNDEIFCMAAIFAVYFY